MKLSSRYLQVFVGQRSNIIERLRFEKYAMVLRRGDIRRSGYEIDAEFGQNEIKTDDGRSIAEFHHHRGKD